MQTGINRCRRYFLTLSTLLVLIGCISVTTQGMSDKLDTMKRNTMNQNDLPKETLCLGRYLIDVDRDATVSSTFKYAGGLLETRTNVTPLMFEQLISGRENTLKNTKHDAGGNMLVERRNLDVNKVIFISWTGAKSQKIHVNESYIYLPKQRVLFLHKTDGSASAQIKNIETLTRVADSYRYRDPNEIPTDPGFCITSGFIATSLTSREDFSTNIRLKKNPSINIRVSSLVTGNPSGSMLARVERETAQLSAPVLAGMATLRKRVRSIGPVEGEEYLVRATEDGKKSYEFVWNSQGKTDSIEFPSMNIGLKTTGRVDGEIITAPFATDEEAMEFWDSILQTLRLRPGAVN